MNPDIFNALLSDRPSSIGSPLSILRSISRQLSMCTHVDMYTAPLFIANNVYSFKVFNVEDRQDVMQWLTNNRKYRFHTKKTSSRDCTHLLQSIVYKEMVIKYKITFPLQFENKSLLMYLCLECYSQHFGYVKKIVQLNASMNHHWILHSFVM